MAETDSEFMDRMSRAIPYNSHLLKAVDLSRLFALARRGAAVQAKPNSTSTVVLTLDQIIQMKRDGRLSETAFIPADPAMSWPDAVLPPPQQENSDE